MLKNNIHYRVYYCECHFLILKGRQVGRMRSLYSVWKTKFIHDNQCTEDEFFSFVSYF